MKTLRLILLVSVASGACAAGPQGFWPNFRATIERYLGLPYAWGACGAKSFDCSGFVWRVSHENGLLMKRTTARKLYFSTLPVNGKQAWRFGDLVFFDDLRHVGIVNDSATFYHAHRNGGTTLSPFRPYWRPKLTGVRRLDVP